MGDNEAGLPVADVTATHLIADDLGENRDDDWLAIAYKETLTLLGDRLLVEYLMDELGSAKP